MDKELAYQLLIKKNFDVISKTFIKAGTTNFVPVSCFGWFNLECIPADKHIKELCHLVNSIGAYSCGIGTPIENSNKFKFSWNEDSRKILNEYVKDEKIIVFNDYILSIIEDLVNNSNGLITGIQIYLNSKGYVEVLFYYDDKAWEIAYEYEKELESAKKSK